MRSASNDSPRPGVTGGIGEVIRVAFPLMVSTGCLSLCLFTDRTLLFWYDRASMAAAMAGGNFFWTLVCAPVGAASMSGAFVAQYIGSAQPQRVGRLMWQTVWFSLLTGLLLLVAAFPAAAWLFRVSGQDPVLVRLEAVYLQYLLCGAVYVIAEAALSGFFSGTERTMIVLWVNVAAAVLNIGLDYLLIFGWGPFPVLGIRGAAIATVVTFLFKVVCYVILILRPAERHRYGGDGIHGIDLALMRRFVFFGMPAGFHYLVESGGFLLIVLQVGQLGADPLAATTVAINFNLIAYVPLVGVAIAVSVLVGRYLTEQGPAAAGRVVRSALLLTSIYTFAWAAVYVLFPRSLMQLYGIGGERTEAELESLVRLLLQFVAAYVVVDGIQVVLAGALRGAGDTWFVLLACGVTASVALSIGFYWEAAVSDKLQWWWWILTAWIWMMAAALIGRFLTGGWRSKRLVEAQSAPPHLG